MQWAITFSEDGSMMTIRASGEPDLVGFMTLIEAAVTDPRWHPDIPVLCDLRKLDAYLASEDNVIHLAHMLADVHNRHASDFISHPVAIIVSQPANFGMVRMWQAYANDIYPRSNVFYEVDSAMTWLQNHSLVHGQ
jgi:hypothetical protein